MISLPRQWNSANVQPPANHPVEIRFSDGSFDLALWTGKTWFPWHSSKKPIAWRALPEKIECDQVA